MKLSGATKIPLIFKKIGNLGNLRIFRRLKERYERRMERAVRRRLFLGLAFASGAAIVLILSLPRCADALPVCGGVEIYQTKVGEEDGYPFRQGRFIDHFANVCHPERRNMSIPHSSDFGPSRTSEENMGYFTQGDRGVVLRMVYGTRGRAEFYCVDGIGSTEGNPDPMASFSTDPSMATLIRFGVWLDAQRVSEDSGEPRPQGIGAEAEWGVRIGNGSFNNGTPCPIIGGMIFEPRQ